MSEHNIQSIRGMRDILPPESDLREQLMNKIHHKLHQFGYLPADLPLLEKTALFQRTIGSETDVVTKEMYTFLDRSEESVTLRPEATAGAVRAIIEQGRAQQVQRLYVEGAMFRYERPQKGRYRQFSQVSVESFGVKSAAQDVELIQLAYELFQELGLISLVRLELNTIGLPEERQLFQKDLVAYLQNHRQELDEDSQRRLETNPLRILDSKDPQVQACLDAAPALLDYLGSESQQHFEQVTTLLNALDIPWRLNPRLVRGLDYYCHTVFEWTTDALGAQSAVCAGGRYDGLVEQLGGAATPAAGFAFGVDRILLLLEQNAIWQARRPLIYMVIASFAEQAMAMQWAAKLRQQFPDDAIVLHNDYQSLKNQFKKADKSGADFVLVFGEQERENQQVNCKDLQSGAQHCFGFDELVAYLTAQKDKKCQ